MFSCSLPKIHVLHALYHVYFLLAVYGLFVFVPGGPPAQQWMARPEPIPGCPPGLEYLTQIDQLLVQQQIELLEGKNTLIIPILEYPVTVLATSS